MSDFEVLDATMSSHISEAEERNKEPDVREQDDILSLLEGDTLSIRISSHGKFVNALLHSDDKKITESTIKFNILFRGNIGCTVLTRCNTRDTLIENGKTYCNSDIGKSDFKKNMEIYYNDNDSGGEIVKVNVVDCDCNTIPFLCYVPDLLLDFEADFSTGYVLYKDDMPIKPYYDKSNEKAEIYEFKNADGDNIQKLLLSDALKYLYRKHIKNKNSKKEIDVYVSSCLYIQPNDIDSIIKGYPVWYECNKNNIILGYEKELEDAKKIYEKTKIEVDKCEDNLEKLKKIKSDIYKNLLEYIKQYIDPESRKENFETIELITKEIDKYIESIGEEEFQDDLDKNVNELYDNIKDFLSEHMIDAEEKFNSINDKYIKEKIEYDEILEAHKKCFQTKRKAESSVDTRTHKKKGGKKKCCKKKCCKKKLSKKKCCKKKGGKKKCCKKKGGKKTGGKKTKKKKIKK